MGRLKTLLQKISNFFKRLFRRKRETITGIDFGLGGRTYFVTIWRRPDGICELIDEGYIGERTAGTDEEVG